MDGKIIKLWYEYLLRSRNYRNYCRAMRTIKPAGSKKNKRIPVIFNKIPYDTYHAWGDIHAVPYRDAYRRFISSGPMQQGSPIKELSQLFKTNSIDLLKIFRKKMGRNITIGEFIKIIEQTFKRRSVLYLKIDVINHSMTEILDHLKSIIKKRKNEQPIKKLSFYAKQNSDTTQKILRIKDLEQYLKVYDLWFNKTKMKDIIGMIGTRTEIEIMANERHDSKYDDVLRKYKLHLQKAKKIIKNVENGFFPGDY
jgi:hypothetical protein